jgi:hypothetical protein
MVIRKETFDKIWNKIKTKVQNEKNAILENSSKSYI